MTTKTNKKEVSVPKTLQGIVVSTKMDKTITVRVERKFPHPLYKKIISKHKKYLVHCEDEGIKDGDLVLIEEGKPISKRKSFYFVKKIER